jgi:RHS repeat-associated protein
VQELVWRADYTPFGDTIVSANGVENALRFPGQYFDEETGLHYNYFRDYDPTVRVIRLDSMEASIHTFMQMQIPYALLIRAV